MLITFHMPSQKRSLPRSGSFSKKLSQSSPFTSQTTNDVVDEAVVESAAVDSTPFNELNDNMSSSEQPPPSFAASAQVVVAPASPDVPTGNNRDRFAASRFDAPATPPRMRESEIGHREAVVFSPGGNRDRFHANCQPLRVCCDLSTVGLHNTATRFTMQAIVLIVYPATEKPERRHLQLIDSRGTTGLTVWGANVSMFTSSSVGQVVRFTKLSLITHNGVKGLTMSSGSTITFVNDVASALEEAKWWASLLDNRPLRIIDVHDCSDDQMVNVSAILGTLWSETKKVLQCFIACIIVNTVIIALQVKMQDRELLCMRITDRTGFIDVRSWNHGMVEFARLQDRPILFKRVRVTSFGGLKILEMLDASGTVVLDQFDGDDDLKQYWLE